MSGRTRPVQPPLNSLSWQAACPGLPAFPSHSLPCEKPIPAEYIDKLPLSPGVRPDFPANVCSSQTLKNYSEMDTLELQEKNKSAASIALLALQRYFLYSRKVFHPSSVRLFCFLHTLQCLQLLSLLIPSDPHKGLPWNYSLCSWLWTSVALCTRPDEAMLSVGLSSSTVSMVYSLCIGGKAVLALAVAVGLAALKEESFDG